MARTRSLVGWAGFHPAHGMPFHVSEYPKVSLSSRQEKKAVGTMKVRPRCIFAFLGVLPDGRGDRTGAHRRLKKVSPSARQFGDLRICGMEQMHQFAAEHRLVEDDVFPEPSSGHVDFIVGIATPGNG